MLWQSIFDAGRGDGGVFSFSSFLSLRWDDEIGMHIFSDSSGRGDSSKGIGNSRWLTHLEMVLQMNQTLIEFILMVFNDCCCTGGIFGEEGLGDGIVL